MFMDRSYLLANGKPTLENVQISLFHDKVFQNPELQSLIINGALDYIDKLWTGSVTSPELLRRIVALFIALGVYQKVFEPQVLARLQHDAVTWSATAVGEKSVSAYVKIATELMDKMAETGEAVGLGASTRGRLMSMMESCLIDRHKDLLSWFLSPSFRKVVH